MDDSEDWPLHLNIVKALRLRIVAVSAKRDS